LKDEAVFDQELQSKRGSEHGSDKINRNRCSGVFLKKWHWFFIKNETKQELRHGFYLEHVINFQNCGE